MSNHVYTSLRDWPTDGNVHDVRIRHRPDWKGEAEICWNVYIDAEGSHQETRRVTVPGCILKAILCNATTGAFEDLEVAIRTLRGIPTKH